MNKNITELIGTYFLVLTIGLTDMHGTPFAPLAIGGMLMVMVYMGGPISGAHYNPAVTLAVLMRKKITGSGALSYLLFQVAGAFLAALTFFMIYDSPMGPPLPPPGRYHLRPLMVEAIFTFALVSVVLNVATSKKSAGNSYFGLAIGFTVAASAFAAGPISAGAFNPAVALGPMLMDAFTGGDSIKLLWIYIAGPFIGAAVAAVVYKLMNPDEE